LQWDCEAEESLENGRKAKDVFQSENAVFLERGLFRLAFGRASCRFAEAPGAQLKENEKMRSSWINNILSPEALSARFDSDIDKRKGKLVFVVSAIDYFFLSVSTPTIATATMTAIAEPMIVMV
jgi:hypothetical protein